MAYPMPEPRLSHAAARRNRDPILTVLQSVLRQNDHVLEIASGSGEHVVHFAKALPHTTWQPSDPTPQSLRSIQAWCEHEDVQNVLSPIALDVTNRNWPTMSLPVSAMVCINMLHIAPWEASIALFDKASELLPRGAPLTIYGPFKRHGEHTSLGNEGFDTRLRRDDRRWGVRDLDGDVLPLASNAGFEFETLHEMPANNLMVVWKKR
ncbi:DUF938 domain-containing protein [Larsenimonas suaedae]|uniref:DUF938 domain-containing protein n=1 Tax=Larsenimonas suaedae TaxID=1851019 RepID=A0ABU1GW75_9GAMM|nr:DUF938 domain-containing protein [Larsenimonas suaedae]MCM2973410.1 class I SAM-dependent methyltransferase [Larsenimonas suaedae]MDR5896303.1 DUF938 domain-containing protein [Larsenimonas suaedae]